MVQCCLQSTSQSMIHYKCRWWCNNSKWCKWCTWILTKCKCNNKCNSNNLIQTIPWIKMVWMLECLEDCRIHTLNSLKWWLQWPQWIPLWWQTQWSCHSNSLYNSNSKWCFNNNKTCNSKTLQMKSYSSRRLLPKWV